MLNSRGLHFIRGVTGVAALTALAALLLSASPADAASGGDGRVRIPAEWEPHAATWLQWPRAEAGEAELREDVTRIIAALIRFETVVIITHDRTARSAAEAFLRARGVPLDRIAWREAAYHWSWMRDNGPIYAVDDEGIFLQDWGFNAWGTRDRARADALVPRRVAEWQGRRCVSYPFVNERGTLEFNGDDALIVSWPVLRHRNPGVSQARLERLFRSAFGVTRIVWLRRFDPDDLTRGHVDGIARFIDRETVVVARRVDPRARDAAVYEDAARRIAASGFRVLRLDIPGDVNYRGDSLPANYMNWLVVNGGVLAPGFAAPDWDEAARRRISEFFPDREVVIVPILDLWSQGGAIHCVTNDEPAAPAARRDRRP